MTKIIRASRFLAFLIVLATVLNVSCHSQERQRQVYLGVRLSQKLLSAIGESIQILNPRRYDNNDKFNIRENSYVLYEQEDSHGGFSFFPNLDRPYHITMTIGVSKEISTLEMISEGLRKAANRRDGSAFNFMVTGARVVEGNSEAHWIILDVRPTEVYYKFNNDDFRAMYQVGYKRIRNLHISIAQMSNRSDSVSKAEALIDALNTKIHLMQEEYKRVELTGKDHEN